MHQPTSIMWVIQSIVSNILSFSSHFSSFSSRILFVRIIPMLIFTCEGALDLLLLNLSSLASFLLLHLSYGRHVFWFFMALWHCFLGPMWLFYFGIVLCGLRSYCLFIFIFFFLGFGVVVLTCAFSALLCGCEACVPPFSWGWLWSPSLFDCLPSILF